VFGARASGSWGFDPVVTVAGVLLHVGLMLLLAIAFSLVAGGLRGARLVAAAAILAALLWLAHVYWPPRDADTSLRTLSPTQLALFYIVLAVALVVGMRLARMEHRFD
jgi:hypothetical protein